MKPLYLSIALASAVAAGLLGSSFGHAATLGGESHASTFPCDDNHFLNDQKLFENGQLFQDVAENVCGTVTYVYPKKKTRSGWHGYFLVQVAPNTVIEIVSDLGQMNAPSWPWVAVGNYVTVRGRYYYDNESSQGIDWTHHGTGSSWGTPGYVVVNGVEYQ
ncbi:DUF3465 domain-containing protein [Dyella tabacisoli]|uniref:DUF3465 domain-containing protein n=1 Tax=Dyella tabacisoli TaxID=2282381 RepID=A0A369ULD4_9GAMM|nr:DUF3465 domain-containing protein [Dyella tabacisoli]RDD81317.1 DUF3465 domain-containing protein [Dyella tabacisoli]